MFMAHATATWTVDQLHRLPDDGNRYELLGGELFVTPPPSPAHELLASRLRSLLEPYVRAHQLGDLYGPRAVVQTAESEVEPDLMLRPSVTSMPGTWSDMPVPRLVVEVLSRTTARRDQGPKRAHYLKIGVADYWIVDAATRTIRVIRKGRPDAVADRDLVWRPSGAPVALEINVAAYFRDVLGAG